MTLPDERYRAIQYTRQFLRDLCTASKTKRIPKEIRLQAMGLLRHYPDDIDLDDMERVAPHIVQRKMEPLYRMIKQQQLDDEIREEIAHEHSINVVIDTGDQDEMD